HEISPPSPVAAGQPSLSTDQYSSPMCLDALNELIISCGHSYSMDCINDYWDKSDTPGIYKCPECRETFTVRPQIKKNAMLNDILEKLKGAESDVGPSQSYAGPDEVSCDECSRRKRKASKTCLTCMASYCEAHLQPNRRSEAFKRHKLEEATGKLQDKLCAKHHKVLEIVCRTDDTCVCLLCVATEHKSHDTRPAIKRNDMLKDIIEKVKDKDIIVSQSQSYTGSDDVPCDVCNGKKMRAVKTCLTCVVCYCEIHLQSHLMSEALRRHKLLEPTENIENKLCKTHKKVLEVFCRTDDTCICLMCATTEHKSHDMVTPEEERAERQVRKGVEIYRIHVMQGIELVKVDEFKYLGLAVQSNGDCWREVKKRVQTGWNGWRRVSGVICDRRGSARVKGKVYRMVERPTMLYGLEMVALTRKQERELEVQVSGVTMTADLFNRLLFSSRYSDSCPLTMDPNTANRRLHLSEDNKKVTDKKTGTQYPNHPDRFDYWEQILCTEALRWTCFYWEVEWSGSGVAIGVTYKGISRKGKSEECRLGHNKKSWSLTCSDSNFFVWHNNKSTTVSVPYSHRIGVYLDCLTSSLSFYSVSDTMTLLHTFKISFTEPIYPGFGVGWDSSVTIFTGCPAMSFLTMTMDRCGQLSLHLSMWSSSKKQFTFSKI
uniref:Uncharacterized protein n=1 Tax=Erpetoichthys calabaricus TaxID=27687 RepID=A0A8C4RCL3_ERPCA